ncbi:MAG: class I SAM-dependent methyltransferase [Alphaproteobacteria bacterium]|nr:class I SAM-dependent methyltransferase [Alphaproteobacteria bacterium]NNF24677.1 methyltransferase domain-containing protein [Paracoccaceae bacterium]
MSRLKDSAKILIGRTSELFQPHLAREIEKDQNPEHAAFLKRQIIFARNRKAARDRDIEELEAAHLTYWKSAAARKYHQSYRAERNRAFLERHGFIIDELAAILAGREQPFSRLVEMGCGDGSLLHHCSDVLDMVPAFIGLDINETAIRSAKAEYGHETAMEFHTAEVTDWLRENPQRGTILLSNNGVLEYFSRRRFDNLLEVLRTSPPAIVVLIEPIAPDFDLATQKDSTIFGNENSFSHNHRERLQNAGFEVLLEEERPANNMRFMLMIGMAG